ncbi:MAG: hypothetical protein H0U59_12190 [Gemmatimonadaceae bacterium]|nr:hypothetical protein [Gemmatimonadaceae bacterium]
MTEIVSVGIGTTTIDAGDYERDGAAGILTRTGDITVPGITYTPGSRTVITYKAGWTLPGVVNFTLPLDIEGAVIGMVRSARFSSGRDPAVKSEWTTDIERIDYWVGSIGENGAFPPDIASMLDPFCYEPAVG